MSVEEDHIIRSMLTNNLAIQAENIEPDVILDFIIQRL